MLGTILLIILILAIIGAIPVGYSRGWGPAPTGGLGLVLLILLLLLLFGYRF